MTNQEIQNSIKKAKSASQTAYTDLLNLYWGDIYRFLNSKCNSEYEAEDLTINTFSKAFDKLEQYNSKYSFKNWLLAIASNLHIDHLRSQNKKLNEVDIEKNHVIIADITPTAEDKLIQEQHLASLLKMIKQLKPNYREVINLRYFQEYSYKEIAEELNESLSSVKVKLLRARKLLSELIQEK